MAFRRMTRSLSKTNLPEQQIHSPQAAATISIKNKNRNQRNNNNNNKSKGRAPHQIESEEMDFLLVGDQQLESALNSGPDFIPQCFLSQPRVDVSQSLSQNGLTFESDLLLACDSDIVNDDWKYNNDSNNSQPGTQLDMVNGIDQVMDYPSVLYSPASLTVTPAADMTTAEHLLQMYMPSTSPAPVVSPLSDECDDIPDEDLLNDLDSILSSYEGTEGITSESLKIEYNPPADTLALALCSQYEPGIHVIEDYSQSSAGDEDEDEPATTEAAATTVVEEQPVAGPSRRGRKPAAEKSSPPAPASRRGRKRKASSSDSDSADSRKKKQNAAAAKNYRKRKAELMNKVFEEKKKVEEELEKAKKKLSGKLNERNILLKMLYESYKENADSSPKILFPDWFDSWYHNQKDE